LGHSFMIRDAEKAIHFVARVTLSNAARALSMIF